MMTRPDHPTMHAPDGPARTWPERFLHDPWAALAELPTRRRRPRRAGDCGS
jgi:hypothetical protein